MEKQLISALIPAYNEEECLYELYNRVSAVLSKLEKYDYEILIINDGSNYGKETAMAAGLDYVKGDVVVILDADLQDPPELIPDMLKYYEEGYDDVYGRRKSRKGETWLKKTTAKIFYKLLQKSTRVDILKDTGDFRVLSRRAVEALKQYKEQRRQSGIILTFLTLPLRV